MIMITLLVMVGAVAGYEYKFDTREMTWSDAENECRRWGGHLTTVRSGAQNNAFESELKRRNMAHAWIGLNDLSTEGSFRWTGPTSYYTNWLRKGGRREPNGGRDQNCVEIITVRRYVKQTRKGKWNTRNCANINPFICERLPAVNGNWGGWSGYGGCSKTCGGGVQGRGRSCNNPPPSHGGRSCHGSNRQTRSCNTGQCPVNGNWGGWSGYGGCSKTCGGGVQGRGRSCNNPPPSFGGRSCPGPNRQTQSCNTGRCPVNGNWGGWSGYSGCGECGGRLERRGRSCNNPSPSHGGRSCPGSSHQIQRCKPGQCPDSMKKDEEMD